MRPECRVYTNSTTVSLGLFHFYPPVVENGLFSPTEIAIRCDVRRSKRKLRKLSLHEVIHHGRGIIDMLDTKRMPELMREHLAQLDTVIELVDGDRTILIVALSKLALVAKHIVVARNIGVICLYRTIN